MNKLKRVRARLFTSEILLFLSNLVLLQREIVMVLTSTLSHLRKMNNIAGYITHDFRVKKPVTGCKLVHLLGEGR